MPVRRRCTRRILVMSRLTRFAAAGSAVSFPMNQRGPAHRSAVLLNLKDVDFSKYEDIVRAYIDSNAFASGHDYLLRRLEESTWQLPDITIRLAERFIAKCGTAAGDISTAAAGDSPTVSKLVVRLYTQTDDDSIRTKCLDLIDEMECLAFYEIDQQLAEHDR